jgi:hypothetical protein
MRHTQQGAKQAWRLLTQLATTLERSADLAEAHAHRREQAGRIDDAAVERQVADRAREAARRARSQAEEWLKVVENQKS